MKILGLAESIRNFDEEHIVEQIILIGVDKKVRNIILEIEEDMKW